MRCVQIFNEIEISNKVGRNLIWTRRYAIAQGSHSWLKLNSINFTKRFLHTWTWSRSLPFTLTESWTGIVFVPTLSFRFCVVRASDRISCMFKANKTFWIYIKRILRCNYTHHIAPHEREFPSQLTSRISIPYELFVLILYIFEYWMAAYAYANYCGGVAARQPSSESYRYVECVCVCVPWIPTLIAHLYFALSSSGGYRCFVFLFVYVPVDACLYL